MVARILALTQTELLQDLRSETIVHCTSERSTIKPQLNVYFKNSAHDVICLDRHLRMRNTQNVHVPVDTRIHGVYRIPRTILWPWVSRINNEKNHKIVYQ